MHTILKKLFVFSVVILISLTFGTPFVHAQIQNNTYTPLAPIPGVNVADGDAGKNCLTESSDAQVSDSNCKTNITTFIPAAIRLVIEIAGALAVVMLVIGGMQYASSDAIGGKSAGKERITNAIWGLVLAIAAFVILQTVNPNTLSLNLGLIGTTASAPTAPSTIPSGTPCDATCAQNNNKPLGTLPTSLTNAGSAWPPASIDPASSDSAIRTALGKSPTLITATADCATVGQTSCTSLDGLTQQSVSGLLNLANDARGTGATIAITGGTEYWEHCVDSSGHSFTPPCDDPTTTTTDHKSGSALDISSNSSALDAVITKTGTVTASSGNGCESSSLGVYTLDGGIYVKESDNQSASGYHWHVCYK